MDPAVVDRRTTLIAGVHESELARRPMMIGGFEGSLDARILSKDMSGPTTRLVTFPAGWGSGVPGALTTDVELFVVEGEMEVSGRVLGRNDYAFIPSGGIIGGLLARSEARGLFMTGAPFRYDTVSGGSLAEVYVVHSAEIEWREQPGHDGRFVKPLRSAPDGEVWLSGSLEWKHEGPWHRHETGEECFVIEGEITLVEMVDGNPEPHTYRRGGYVWRPPRALHAGPGSEARDTALAFHRVSQGTLQTEWIGPGDLPLTES